MVRRRRRTTRSSLDLPAVKTARRKNLFTILFLLDLFCATSTPLLATRRTSPGITLPTLFNYTPLPSIMRTFIVAVVALALVASASARLATPELNSCNLLKNETACDAMGGGSACVWCACKAIPSGCFSPVRHPLARRRALTARC